MTTFAGTEEPKIGSMTAPDPVDSKASEAENGDIMSTDTLHRRLSNRQIQFIAIGASVGTGVFVTVGTGLHRGGPVGLLLAWILYTCVMALSTTA
ncbi:hypothetical protein ACHAPT_011894 [Fusarium lateritium]